MEAGSPAPGQQQVAAAAASGQDGREGDQSHRCCESHEHSGASVADEGPRDALDRARTIEFGARAKLQIEKQCCR